jgi:hypothetical protein
MTDEDLQRYIDAATVTAERVAGRGLAARDRVEVVSGSGSKGILVSSYPVQSITSVKISGTGDFDAAETVTDYEIESESGMIYRRSLWPSGSRNIQVVYNGGYGLPVESPGTDPDYLVPDDLTRAVCEVIDWMYQRDRNQTIGIRTTIGADGLQTSYSLDVPLSARSVFESYREVRV